MHRIAIGRMVSGIALALALGLGVTLALASPTQVETPEISGGGALAGMQTKPSWTGPLPGKSGDAVLPPEIHSYVSGNSFPGPDFDLNPTLNGGIVFIPPDPIGAAGPDRVIAVVNTVMEARSKAGVVLWQSALGGFFSPLPCWLGSTTFDPKIVYDHYAGRFVVVALEQAAVGVNPSASNRSRILLAVSKTSSPATATAADWWFCCIDSKLVLGGFDYWADYPGFEVDEEAIYVTANMFRFPGVAGAYGGARLWIVAKGAGSGGFYDGGGCAVTMHDPYAATPGSVATTTMPAEVRGAGGAGPGVGTYLVSYSGLSDGVLEYVQVIRVNNPLGAVSFTHEFLPVGDLETFVIGTLPDAPQLGGPELIEVNDRRALDAVWSNNGLYITTTLLPDGPALPGLADHTTAYWFHLDTSAVTGSGSPAGLLTLAQQGGLPGEELAAIPGDVIVTYFPSVAVNSLGEVKFGFSASGASIFAAAATAGRKPSDAPGTTRPAVITHPGTDYYVRTFDAPACQTPPARNRWGDYSGMSVDPTDERIFWIFNQMAITRGTPTSGGCNGRPHPEDGRWGTGWAECAFACVTATCAQDIIVGNGFGNGSHFSLEFCFTNCGGLPTTYDFVVSDTQGWGVPTNGSVNLAPGATHCVTVNYSVPGATPGGTTSTVTLVATPQGAPLDAASCSTLISVDETVPVAIENFTAAADAGGVLLSWRLGANWRSELTGIGLQRATHELGPYISIDARLEPADAMSYLDRDVETGREYWYRLVTQAADGSAVVGPVRATAGAVAVRTQLFAPVEPADGGPVQIHYSLAAASGQTRIEILDVRGRRVRELDASQRGNGTYVKTWDRLDETGTRAARGVYFVSLVTAGQRHSEKLLLLRP